MSSDDRLPPPRAVRGHVLLDEDEEPGGPHLWRRLLIIPVLAVLVGGVLALYFSPLLRVHQVEVVGTKTVDAYALAQASGLKGRSMLTTRLSDVEDKLLSAQPMIKSVQAERIWPDTVRLVIEEREPWGYWHTSDGDFVVDSDGVVLEGVSPPSEGLIIYQENETKTFQPGDRVDADAVRLAKQLMEYSATALDLTVVRLEYNDREGLSLVTNANYRVVLGDSHSLDYKLAVWEALEQRLGREQIVGHVLDLRFGDRPSLR